MRQMRQKIFASPASSRKYESLSKPQSFEAFTIIPIQCARKTPMSAWGWPFGFAGTR
jgi:hypothetical protein